MYKYWLKILFWDKKILLLIIVISDCLISNLPKNRDHFLIFYLILQFVKSFIDKQLLTSWFGNLSRIRMIIKTLR